MLHSRESDCTETSVSEKDWNVRNMLDFEEVMAEMSEDRTGRIR